MAEYGIHPWQMERWTGSELGDLSRYHQQVQAARREAEEGG